jgi:hypothetical protein
MGKFTLVVTLIYASFPGETHWTEFKSMVECMQARQKKLIEIKEQKLAAEHSDKTIKGVAELPTSYSAVCIGWLSSEEEGGQPWR